MDEKGTTWTRPTAWAYAKVCEALHNKEGRLERSRESAKPVREWLAQKERFVSTLKRPAIHIDEYEVGDLDLDGIDALLDAIEDER